MQKHKQGSIGLAHLSDVLRFGLLSNYGGVWVDATVYLADAFPREMFTETFYTQCFSSWNACPQEACRGKWCGFFLAGKADNIIFPYMYEALCWWWENHDRAVDYVFFDYILWAGFCSVSEIKRQIDQVRPGNENIWVLEKCINDVYDPAAFEQLRQSNVFYKLSYKMELKKVTSDGKKTVYAHILEENGVV